MTNGQRRNPNGRRCCKGASEGLDSIVPGVDIQVGMSPDGRLLLCHDVFGRLPLFVRVATRRQRSGRGRAVPCRALPRLDAPVGVDKRRQCRRQGVVRRRPVRGARQYLDVPARASGPAECSRSRRRTSARPSPLSRIPTATKRRPALRPFIERRDRPHGRFDNNVRMVSACSGRNSGIAVIVPIHSAFISPAAVWLCLGSSMCPISCARMSPSIRPGSLPVECACSRVRSRRDVHPLRLAAGLSERGCIGLMPLRHRGIQENHVEGATRRQRALWQRRRRPR